MIKTILLNIIEKKYEELGLNKKDKKNIFWKIQEFEGNAIGQIGEKFVRKILENLKIKINNKEEVLHDEYDLLLPLSDFSTNVKIEIKTASLGRKNNTFQFNGIILRYNYEKIIFIGISQTNIFYKIVDKNKDIKYIHKLRKYFVSLNTNKTKQLVKMNPNNEVNFKLTLNVKDMIDISYFEAELKKLFQFN